MNPLQKALLAEVKANIDEYWGKGAFEATYLRERHTCVPENYLGDDIHDAIHDLFYAVFRPIADMVEKRTGMALVSVVVEADYENSTGVILYGHYEGQEDVLLLVVWRKAWWVWWNSPEEMGRDLEAWYNQALKAARTALRLRHIGGGCDAHRPGHGRGAFTRPIELGNGASHHPRLAGVCGGIHPPGPGTEETEVSGRWMSI